MGKMIKSTRKNYCYLVHGSVWGKKRMIIKSVRVRNFRCIKDETLYCDNLTALVGPNGSGKSTFLKALNKFYESAAKIVQEDFYGNDVSEPIIISVTFTDLAAPEKEILKSHMNGDELVVEKEVQFASKPIQKYYGYSLLNPDFKILRDLAIKEEKKAEYDKLKSGAYRDLTELRGNASVQKMDEALREWEKNHQDKLSLIRDDGQFFGFKEVGEAHLERYTRFLYIPAIQDASIESADGKGTVINALMNLVVRSQLARKEDLKSFREDVQTRYREILNPSIIPELTSLETELTSTIDTFAPGTQLRLRWLETQMIIPDPSAQVRVVEEGYESELDRAGDGVKRAFILTTLQHLEAAKVNDIEGSDSGSELPNLILGIEEPELFQHPSRERHIAKILLDLANGSIGGVAKRTQVIYTTHSPLMVDLTRFDQIRIVKRIDNGQKPRKSKVYQSTMIGVTREMERVNGAVPGIYSVETERARLHTLMTPWTNEGFFANIVVLVEGEGDRAAILGSAKAINVEMDSLGISVIPCIGKRQVLKAAVIFRSFGLPVYTVWDCDEGSRDCRPEDNHALFRLHDALIEDYCERIECDYACFRQNLDFKLAEIIPNYTTLLSRLREQYGYGDNVTAKKNPSIIETMLRESSCDSHERNMMYNIIEKIRSIG